VRQLSKHRSFIVIKESNLSNSVVELWWRGTSSHSNRWRNNERIHRWTRGRL